MEKGEKTAYVSEKGGKKSSDGCGENKGWNKGWNKADNES